MTILLYILFILLIYKFISRKEGYYDTREGTFASIVTQRDNPDGTNSRQAIHFQGTPDDSSDSGFSIQRVDEGVMSVSHLDFLDRFYGGDDHEKLYQYVMYPKTYPSQAIMQRISENKMTDIESELENAKQEANEATTNLLNITNALIAKKQTLTPIVESNEERQIKIDELTKRLSTAKQQAKEAADKYNNKAHKIKNINKISVFDHLFGSTTEELKNISDMPNDIGLLARDLGVPTTYLEQKSNPIMRRRFGTENGIYVNEKPFSGIDDTYKKINDAKAQPSGSVVKGFVNLYKAQLDTVKQVLQEEWKSKFVSSDGSEPAIKILNDPELSQEEKAIEIVVDFILKNSDATDQEILEIATMALFEYEGLDVFSDIEIINEWNVTDIDTKSDVVNLIRDIITEAKDRVRIRETTPPAPAPAPVPVPVPALIPKQLPSDIPTLMDDLGIVSDSQKEKNLILHWMDTTPEFKNARIYLSTTEPHVGCPISVDKCLQGARVGIYLPRVTNLMSAHDKNETAKQIVEATKKGHAWRGADVATATRRATSFFDETQKDVDVIINLLQHEWKHKYSSDPKPDSPPLLDQPPPSRPIPDNIPELMKDLEIGDMWSKGVARTRFTFFISKWRREGLYGGLPFMIVYNDLKNITARREKEIQGANRANYIAYYDGIINNKQADVDTLVNLLQIEWRKIYT